MTTDGLSIDLAVAAVHRLDVHRAPNPLAGRGVDALMRDVERRRDGRMQRLASETIRGEDRLQSFTLSAFSGG